MSASLDTFPVIKKRPTGHLPVRELTPEEIDRSRRYHGLPPDSSIELLREKRIRAAVEELFQTDKPDQFSEDIARTDPSFVLAINQARQDIARCSALLKAEGIDVSENLLEKERTRRALHAGFAHL